MVDDFTAEDKQRQNRQERQARGQNRPAQRLVDTVVHDRSQIVAPANLQVFADAVENDDRVVHRITDQRQQAPRSP